MCGNWFVFCLVFFFLKRTTNFSCAAFMSSLWISVKEQYLQRKGIDTLWISDITVRTVK